MKLSFCFISLLLFSFFTFNFIYSQDDDNIRIGPEEIMRPGGAHYYNYADKNKVNIEVVVMGGGAAGKYLIPDGTTVFDLLIMAGGTSEASLEDIKLIRFRSDSPLLQGKEVIQLDYSNLYGDKKDLLKTQQNPKLHPGDMIIIPVTQPTQPFWYYVREFISYVGTFVSFYYLIYGLFFKK